MLNNSDNDCWSPPYKVLKGEFTQDGNEHLLTLGLFQTYMTFFLLWNQFQLFLSIQ